MRLLHDWPPISCGFERPGHVNRYNSDLVQFALKGVACNGPNQVQVNFKGSGNLAYQVAGRYFVPWGEHAGPEPLSIDVAYDRARRAQDDVATATATVRNNMNKSANMVMVDLGIPPGFDLLSEDFQEHQAKGAGRRSGRLQKFNTTATQAILYFDTIAPGDTGSNRCGTARGSGYHFSPDDQLAIRQRFYPLLVIDDLADQSFYHADLLLNQNLHAPELVTIRYRLRAKYPIRARTFQSRVYEYYDPDVKSVSQPALLEVSKR